MKFLLINLSVNTQNNHFHHLGIDGKFELIDNCIKHFSPNIDRMGILDESPFKAMLVAPEYFFARCCPEKGGKGHRHYEYADYIRIRQKLSSVSRQYPNVLFVPGTIAWKSPIVKGELARVPSSLPSDVAAVPIWESREYNSEEEYHSRMIEIGEITEKGVLTKSWATYAREAPDRDLLRASELLKSKFARLSSDHAVPVEEKIRILSEVIDQGLNPEKYIEQIRAAKDISFVRNTAFFYLNGRKVGEYTKHSDYQEIFFRVLSRETAIAINDMGPSVLDICGVKIGVEICFDHYHNILDQAVKNGSSLMPDIHLILSAAVENFIRLQGPIRIHSSITSALDKSYTELPIVNRKEFSHFSAYNGLAAFESVPVDIPATFAHRASGVDRSMRTQKEQYPSGGHPAYFDKAHLSPSRSSGIPTPSPHRPSFALSAPRASAVDRSSIRGQEYPRGRRPLNLDKAHLSSSRSSGIPTPSPDRPSFALSAPRASAVDRSSIRGQEYPSGPRPPNLDKAHLSPSLSLRLFTPLISARDFFNYGMKSYEMGNNGIARECFSKIVLDHNSLQFSSLQVKRRLIATSTEVLREINSDQVFGLARKL